MTKNEALVAMDRLEQLIQSFGGQHDDEHHRFQGLINTLRRGPVQMPYFREKLADLERWADMGFSRQKFERYPGGLQQLNIAAMISVDTIRSLVDEHWPG